MYWDFVHVMRYMLAPVMLFRSRCGSILAVPQVISLCLIRTLHVPRDVCYTDLLFVVLSVLCIVVMKLSLCWCPHPALREQFFGRGWNSSGTVWRAGGSPGAMAVSWQMKWGWAKLSSASHSCGRFSGKARTASLKSRKPWWCLPPAWWETGTMK